MKFRSDFVTNSSSSSFLLGFTDKEDGIRQISQLTQLYGLSYIETLLHDFESAEPVSIDELTERYLDEFKNIASYNLDWSNRTRYGLDDSSFRAQWKRDHPDAKDYEYYQSEERQQKLYEMAKPMLDELITQARSKGYLVEVEYEDHSDVGSELEHEILPCQEFTLMRFSHH